ncbi:MAG TPA: hypothetical protein VNX68_05135, partial [Nitrosopumilaceae archaeon]|nr:hypothetical protein [Nitrosopumilaceae archaeon]
ARGTSVAQGSFVSHAGKSIREFGHEERARALSQGFRQNQMKSQMRLYGINQQARKATRANQYMMQSINMFSFNSLGQNPFGQTGENYG